MNTCYNCSRNTQLGIGLAMAGLMCATRFHHFGDALHLADASWAIFFLAGFYLPTGWLWGLMSLAVVIDYSAIQWGGVAAYCVTSAYAFLIPTYTVLWAGGRWLASRYSLDVAGAVRLVLAGTVATSLAFLISNASFFWLGGRVVGGNLAIFGQTFIDYAPRYFAVTGIYLAVAVLAHLALTQRTSARLSA